MTHLESLTTAFNTLGIMATTRQHEYGTDLALHLDQGDDTRDVVFEFDEDGAFLGCAGWKGETKP
jgi:hypothetical protein